MINCNGTNTQDMKEFTRMFEVMENEAQNISSVIGYFDMNRVIPVEKKRDLEDIASNLNEFRTIIHMNSNIPFAADNLSVPQQGYIYW